MQGKIKSKSYEKADTYTEISNYSTDIEKRKKRISDLRKRKQREADQTSEDDKLIERALSIEKLGTRLAKQCDSIKRIIRKEIDKPDEAGRRRRLPAKLPEAGTEPQAQPGPPEKIQTLGEVLAIAGWRMDDNCSRLVAILQSTLEETLGANSVQYRQVVAALAERAEQFMSE